MHPLKGGAHLNRETSAHCSSGDCLVLESLVLGGVGMTCTLGSLEGRQSAISSLAPWSPDRVEKQPSRFPQVLVKQGGVDEADVVDMLPSEKMFSGGRGGVRREVGQSGVSEGFSVTDEGEGEPSLQKVLQNVHGDHHIVGNYQRMEVEHAW